MDKKEVELYNNNAVLNAIFMIDAEEDELIEEELNDILDEYGIERYGRDTKKKKKPKDKKSKEEKDKKKAKKMMFIKRK